MSSFFEELKRRKVYRVAVAYFIVGGGIIQLASAVFPAWELPDWTLRVVEVLLLLGFPIALILAWAFDVTPQGIQTTSAVASSTSGDPHRPRNIFLLVVVGIAISGGAGFFLLPRAVANRTEKSIAVLPFENYSDDKKNAYFADGIQDDILTNLARIGDLKVISRTSVMAYRNRPESLRKIGKTLGVSAILEGSVRKVDNRVRVNVQLINAENDQHIWAQEYDEELTDVFKIQTDLAQRIAKELHARLSPSEKEQMTRKPTENGEAYLAFVEGHNLQSAVEDIRKLKQAVQLYERAIELDPNFVLAIANLSILHSWIYHNNEPTEVVRDLAKKYADRASQLQPDAPEAHLARGYFLYYGARDFAGALREFGIAQRGLPNDSQIYLLIGAIQRRQGLWKESTANLERAVDLNPNDTWPLQNLFFNYNMLRNFEAAERTVDRALAIDPKSFSLWAIKAQMAISARGDFSVAEKGFAVLEQEMKTNRKMMEEQNPEMVTEIARAKASVRLLQGKYYEVLEALRQLPDEPGAGKPDSFVEARLCEGIAHEKLGQVAEARAAFLKGKEVAEGALREAPNEARRHAALAQTLAHLGEKEAAIAEAKRATELLPESADAFEGPRMTAILAEVYAVTGESAKAIELLDGLLSRPGDMNVALLKLDPAMDGLRNDPVFQEMLSKH